MLCNCYIVEWEITTNSYINVTWCLLDNLLKYLNLSIYYKFNYYKFNYYFKEMVKFFNKGISQCLK